MLKLYFIGIVDCVNASDESEKVASAHRQYGASLRWKPDSRSEG